MNKAKEYDSAVYCETAYFDENKESFDSQSKQFGPPALNKSLSSNFK